MKKVVLNTIAYAVAAGIMFTACKKEDEAPVQPTEKAVEDNSMSMAESDEVLAIAEEEMNSNYSNMRIDATQETHENSHGATITFTPKGSNATGSILIDFGTTGIKSDVDGKTRKGKILITFTGKYRTPGTTQTITFDNYQVNGNKVEGTQILTHAVENNTYKTNVKITGGKISYTDNTTITWNSEHVRTWNLNGTLLNFEDDEFTVSGTSSGKARDGKNFSSVIAVGTPLLWKFSCLSESRFVAVSGIVKVMPEGGQEWTADYGNGSCDREVVVKSGNFTATITLEK
ncbi:YfhO family protein [Rhodocytophaga rosea]|uniref:YfhO family protein n=1 Tax=Rhodocytophaga rosea TaxID=2704465 RepID=A0A6C0GJV5_9BACT|nr:YfhO family protein [Rhodocytophaga rosea]QHT68239.1 YfhO family protein [Rhodocytophaga rosea]